MTRARRASQQAGFTLLELLVVIGIILLLMAILLPVVKQVQLRAQGANTQNQMMRIMSGCQMYYHDFNAYPGPIANVYLDGGDKATSLSTVATYITPPTGTFDGGTANGANITSSENLVLGLFGMLTPPPVANPNSPVTFTQSTVGPIAPPLHDVLSLNTLHPQTFHYMDWVADELSPGPVSALEYTAGKGSTGAASTSGDTMIPEFVDRFSKPMPILYMRANPGNTGTVLGGTTYFVGNSDVGYQYNYKELQDYICFLRYSNGTAPTKELVQPDSSGPTAVGAGLFFDLFTAYNASTLADDIATPVMNTSTSPATPATFNLYLQNPNVSNSVRGKDGFVLISAGIDRTFGTTDDYIVTP